jgi:hypothetical protein
VVLIAGPQAVLNPAVGPGGWIPLWPGKATEIYDVQAVAGTEHPHAQP